MISRRMIKAGLRQLEHDVDKTHRKQIPIDHGFRMFFCSQLVNADLNTEKRYLLEGHSLLNNDKSYVRVKEELHDEYINAIPVLTIDPKNKLEKEVKKLTEQNNEVVVKELEHKRTVQMLVEQITELRRDAESGKTWRENMEKCYNEMVAKGEVNPPVRTKVKVKPEVIEKIRNLYK